MTIKQVSSGKKIQLKSLTTWTQKSLTSKNEIIALPISGNLWKWFSIHLDENDKNDKNHGNWEVPIFVFILRTRIKLPRPSRACISKEPQVSKGCHVTEATCAIPSLMVELGGVSRPDRGAGCRIGGPKRVQNVYCTGLKIQTEVLNLRTEM